MFVRVSFIALVLISLIVSLVACSNGNNDGDGGFSGESSFNHSLVAGEACATCHNGDNATGKPVDHHLTTNLCEACHGTDEWIPIVEFSHEQSLGNCVSCHNGIDFTGKPPSHINSSNVCDACHRINTWVPTNTVDHSQVFGTCSSCHNNIIAYGMPRSHIPTVEECNLCHSTVSWFAVSP